MKNPIRIRAIIAMAAVLLMSSQHGFGQNEKAIFGDILKDYNRLSNNLSIEQRIEVFESIQSNVEKIINEYPATDEAIKLLAGQKVGNFDLAHVQDQYIDELQNYYGKVCEVTPSKTCLAFVSLKIGAQQCANAKNFDDIGVAQTKIKNAIKIFSQDEQSDRIKNLALSEFRNCAVKSKLNNKDQLRDYFLRQLVPLYLDINDEGQARAVIQQLSNPYLIFLSVLDLTDHKGGVTVDFLRRMEEYIDEKSIVGVDKAIAGMDLDALALQNGITDESFSNYRELSGACKRGSDDLIFFNKAIDYVEITPNVKNEMTAQLGNNGVMNHWRVVGNDMSDFLVRRCGSDGLAEALKGYVYFRVTSKELAEQYLQAAKAVNFDIDEMQNIAFDIRESQNLDDPSVRFPFIAAYPSAMLRLRAAKEYEQMFSYPFNDYIKLKITISEGKLCESVQTLFAKYINNSNASQKQVADLLDYTLASGLLDSDESCGDASLELLLQ